ncbi:target of rapamycin (TOR) kinase 1 [Trypanosoma grayi]|uniref:target of rapamycin (TOR) kinase 1 n=1 Tax=Trypanosoma grayi TaxID=71804 RepID=UPI0004F471FB|nr:target of rapamycin (TOR) kinase 1 [Trypanosoma grayi]KEG08135.1 target of rapamycin (TOR) kinase 1 [Trypanosoma grayi]
MKQAGTIRYASDGLKSAWVVLPPLVGNGLSGGRWRFGALPRATGAAQGRIADVPLGHISHNPDAVHGGCTTLLDLKAFFFQVGLAEGIRAGPRCRRESGELVGANRLPMGFKRFPEILHSIARVEAGGPGWPNCVMQPRGH